MRILERIPGLTVTPAPRKANRRADATIRFAGTRVRVALAVKRRANAATAWQLVHEATERPDTPLLLIAAETTAEARRILADHGVAVLDGLGNAHLELPGLLFHLSGRRAPQRTTTRKPPTRLSGKAGVAAQALLLRPEHAWKVQDLATEAQISAGLAHRVIARLEREGVLAAEGTGPNRVRRVSDATALLDLWAEECVEHPTVTLGYKLARTPQQLIKNLGTALEQRGIDHAMTGAAGATLLAPFITAVPVVDLWVTAKLAPDELREAVEAEHVTDGQNVVFLQGKDDTPLTFREKIRGLWLANRFRLYADLRRDPRRGREQAAHLRQEVIGF